MSAVVDTITFILSSHKYKLYGLELLYLFPPNLSKYLTADFVNYDWDITITFFVLISFTPPVLVQNVYHVIVVVFVVVSLVKEYLLLIFYHNNIW